MTHIRPTRTLRLLLVDDSDVDRLVARRALRQARFSKWEVEEVALLAEARALSPEDFDVACLDLRLPDGSGFDLLREWFVEDSLRVPVVVLSGEGELQAALQAIELGASDYLGKDALRPSRLELSLLNAIKLHQQAAEVRERNATLSRFAAVVAHEIRNPIGAALGAIQTRNVLAESGGAEADLVAMTQTAERALLRASRTVDRLLTAARAGLSEAAVQAERIELSAFLQAADDEMRPAFAQDGVQLTVSSAGTAFVLADADLLSRVMANLLDNARRHTPRGGTVDVTASIDGGWVEIRVQDSGEGVAAEVRDRVFDQFKGSGGGEVTLGLGLWVAHTAVRRMGGDLTLADSEPGEGACFMIKLPLAGEPSADP